VYLAVLPQPRGERRGTGALRVGPAQLTRACGTTREYDSLLTNSENEQRNVCARRNDARDIQLLKFTGRLFTLSKIHIKNARLERIDYCNALPDSLSLCLCLPVRCALPIQWCGEGGHESCCAGAHTMSRSTQFCLGSRSEFRRLETRAHRERERERERERGALTKSVSIARS
jgi:hypothetical protein